MPVKVASASFRDRTQEFQSIAERLKKSFSSFQNGPISSSSSTSSGSRSEEQRTTIAMQSEFNRRASKIGFGIHQTSQKLAKLAKLAKRTSDFDDPTTEIQELTAVINQDITALNSAVVDLQLHSNSRNERGNSDTTSHATTVVDGLKNRLMTATKEFKEVLTMRTENMKVHENRRLMISSSTTKEASNPFMRQRPLAGFHWVCCCCPLASRNTAITSASPPPRANDSASSSQLFPRKQGDGNTQPLLQDQQQQQQQIVPLQDSYMQSRAEALQNAESTIHELGSIFNQLATLVSEQGEVAVRIDENMDDALTNVEGAQGALLSEQWTLDKV
ncbi:hypothetical protein KY285_034609 [Solanum tuberosum]|nr:hypothetical protein KY285_034609 [Solanum tuberosum]